MASIENKQLYLYLRPLLQDVNKDLVNKLYKNFNSFDLSKDAVFCSKHHWENEVFISILFSLHTSDPYVIIPATRLISINDAYKTGYRDSDYGALSSIVDTKILFITIGGYEVPSYMGNIIDVLVSTRRSMGLRTFIFNYGSKVDFLNLKSTLMTNVNSLSIGGGSSV